MVFSYMFIRRSSSRGDQNSLQMVTTIEPSYWFPKPSTAGILAKLDRSEDILIQYQRMFNYDVYTPPTTAGTLREMTLYIATVLRKSYHPCFWDIEWFYTTPSSLYSNFPLYCFRIHTQKYIFCRLLSL